MSLNRVLRYLGGLVIATLLLVVILPLAGVVPAKFLPPAVPYASADGKAQGRVTAKETSATANPFKVGDHVYLFSYEFYALTPPPRGVTTPGPKQIYQGQMRVMDETTYNAITAGQPIRQITYVKSDPDINGIDPATTGGVLGGRSVGAGSNILSGWILFLLLDLALAYFFMAVVLERFGKQENI